MSQHDWLFLPKWSKYGIEKRQQERKVQEKTMPMNDCSTGAGQNATEIVMLNQKLAYDIASQLQLDNQANSRAWNAFTLETARDAQVVKHLAQISAVISNQTGQDEEDNIVKPTPNVVADDNAAVASGAISSATAQATLANVTAQVGELVSQVVGLAAAVSAMQAMMAQMITNAGTANPKG